MSLNLVDSFLLEIAKLKVFSFVLDRHSITTDDTRETVGRYSFLLAWVVEVRKRKLVLGVVGLNRVFKMINLLDQK